MSIEGKHHYRFEYLKSEKWSTVRLEALAREHGRRQICNEESFFNDAHHAWYPESVWDTTERHLVILCRSCHNFIHTLIPECKTNDEVEGLAMWEKFRTAIKVWKLEKAAFFESPPGIVSGKPVQAKELRDAYNLLKDKAKFQESILNEYRDRFGRLSSDADFNEIEIDAL